MSLWMFMAFTVLASITSGSLPWVTMGLNDVQAVSTYTYSVFGVVG